MTYVLPRGYPRLRQSHIPDIYLLYYSEHRPEARVNLKQLKAGYRLLIRDVL